MRYHHLTLRLTGLFILLVMFALSSIAAAATQALSAEDRALYELILGLEDDTGFIDLPPLETEDILGERRVVPQALYPEINAVTFNGGRPVIEFQVTDEFGIGIPGFSQNDNVRFSFTVSKLVPGTSAETDNWSTYIRTADQGVQNAQGGTYSNGTLVDNGDGTYRFTFDSEVQAISDVDFEPDLTHRIGIEIRNAVVLGRSVEGSDAVFDVQPSSGATEGITERRIIKQQSCANCHGTEEFAFHGGPRRNVDFCVTCHQKGGIDVGTGNTIDFRVMIHKIHFGEELTNQPFQICGFGCENFGAPPDDFSGVEFPQDTRNCTTCHDPADPETPQADNVNNRATAAVCTSCHDDLAFDETGLTNANENHPGLAQPNENCAACHSEDGLIPSILESHRMLAVEAGERFQYNILQISDTAEGQSPWVVFSITDPTNDDAPYDLAADPAFSGSQTRVRMLFSWPTTDYTNVANSAGTEILGSTGGRGLNVQFVDASGLRDFVSANGDGTYTLDTSLLDPPLVVPSTDQGLGSGTVSIEGRVSADLTLPRGVFDDRVSVFSANRTFAINDPAPRPRRAVVDIAKCQNCHGIRDGLTHFHGGDRSGNVQHCVTCHNPNATDIRNRPADPDGVANAVNTNTADGMENQTIDFKHMIHAVHAADMRNFPYVIATDDFSEVQYPRLLSECQACHLPGTYSLPLGDQVLASTVHTGATNLVGRGGGVYAPSEAVARDPTDDNNLSPEGSVCSSCHDSDLAIEHMSVRSDSFISFGNAFLNNPFPITDPDTQERIDMEQPQENCFFCHGPGRIVDIAVAHGLEE